VCALSNPRLSPKPPVLCYVTDRNIFAAEASASIDLLLQKIEQVISAGIDWLQIREKDLSAKELSRLAREALRISAKHSAGPRSTPILINDRLDIALSESAGGIHLAGNSLPVTEAKQLVKKFRPPGSKDLDFVVGASCHSRQDAEAAAASGADYIFFGPVFATPSKTSFGAPQGLDRLAEICRTVAIPVIAIGGITLDNAESCIVAGAAGIAAIRLFQDATDPITAIQRLRQRVSYHHRR
jgi:thiamine-phosphate pyrophosphorylase